MSDMRRLVNLERCLAVEGGFALIVAMFVLLIISVLVATAIAVASQTSTSTTRDTNSKASFEAAEAGLQVAAFRLSKLEPVETACITGTAAAFPTLPTTGEHVYCEDVSKEILGNGATFQYWTSKALAVGVKCGGTTTVAGQRCITSEGIVDGVKPGTRLQVLVESKAGEALFPVKGFLGLKKVLVSGSVSIPGVVASNGEIKGEGSANFQNGYEICTPEGKFSPSAGTERRSSGVKIHGESPGPTAGYEKIRAASECQIKAPVPSGHPTPESNEDGRIGVADKLSGPHHTWEKYEFSMEGSETEDILTLGEAGKTTRYFFCSFKLSGGALFKIAKEAKVEIYIGNSEEYPTTCAVPGGKFVIEGGAKTENISKNPAALLIIVGGKGPFAFTNGSGKTLEASVYAPNAKVILSGGVEFKGGIVGQELLLEGGSKLYEWSEETGKLGTGGSGTYERKSWEQCTPGSGASEGC
jgi:Tfp pilus assembly protein PilX